METKRSLPAGFITTLKQAQAFYKRCNEVNAVTFDERYKLLLEMQRERKMFPQTQEQIDKRMSGKKVLKLTMRPKKGTETNG